MNDDQEWVDFFEDLGVTLRRALIASYVVAILIGVIIGALAI